MQQIAMGGMDFGNTEPACNERWAAWTKAAAISWIPSSVRAVGTTHPSSKATALGKRSASHLRLQPGCRTDSPTGERCLPYGRRGPVECRQRSPLRDEVDNTCQRFDMIVAPNSQVLWADAALRRYSSSFGQHQSGPPDARLPRWTRCQSLAEPSTLEYWHMGDTAIRLGIVMLRRVSCSNRWDMIDSPC